VGSAIAEVVPAAIGMALINPLPIKVVILMLFSPRAMSTATAFLAGWVLGIIAIFGLLLFAATPEAIVGDDREPSLVASLVRFLLGITLLFLAFRKWRSRPQPGEDLALPSWMGKIDAATPITALGFGAVFSGLNPKNLAIIVAAVIAIAEEELTTGEKLVPVAVYTLLASVGVAAPVIWYAVAPASAGETLAGWRRWLMENYATMMTIVLLLFGVILVTKGLGALIG
jgi:hypothetical protein